MTRSRDLADVWAPFDPPADAVSEGEFDPAEHTVAEVLEHLDGADETEAERVLAAEAAGKNRSSLVS